MIISLVSKRMIYHSNKAIAYGQELKRLRLSRKLTQAELSFKVEIASQYISKFETGARYPWESARDKLREFFGVDIDCLITSTEK